MKNLNKNKKWWEISLHYGDMRGNEEEKDHKLATCLPLIGDKGKHGLKKHTQKGIFGSLSK